MLSYNTYHLTWVSLTLDVGYLFTAAPVQSLLLTLDEGYLLTAASPDLGSGVAPLRQRPDLWHEVVLPSSLDLGCGVARFGRRP